VDLQRQAADRVPAGRGLVAGVGEVERVAGLGDEDVVGAVVGPLAAIAQGIDAGGPVAVAVVLGGRRDQAVRLVEPFLRPGDVALDRRRR
jgi:hypothetical protein